MDAYKFLQSIGEMFGSVYELVLFVSIILITFIAAYLFSRTYKRLVLKPVYKLGNDPTNYKFLKHAIVAMIYITGIGIAVYRIEIFRGVANSILATAGLLAVVVGFASQHALSNIISGIFLVIFKPFGINDRLIIKDTLFGVVEDITLRHTVIRDLENRRIIIPNSVISNEILINHDLVDENVCRLINIGISYDSNVKQAKRLIREEIVNHPLNIDGRTQEQIDEGQNRLTVRMVSYGDSSINIRAWAWAKNYQDGIEMHCDVLESIKERFDQEGIEIPFPYRTLVFKNQLPTT